MRVFEINANWRQNYFQGDQNREGLRYRLKFCREISIPRTWHDQISKCLQSQCLTYIGWNSHSFSCYILLLGVWIFDTLRTCLILDIWIQINEANAERNGKSNITPCIKEAHILKTIIVSNSTPFLKKKNYEQKKIWISIALNFQRRIDLLEIADKVILGQEIYIYIYIKFDTVLYFFTVSPYQLLKYKGHASLAVFPLNIHLLEIVWSFLFFTYLELTVSLLSIV